MDDHISIVSRKLLINLFGGPGSGKSTAAYSLFSVLKKKGMNVEVVPELIKSKVYRAEKLTIYDQWVNVASQAREEDSRISKCDIVICECPAKLSACYTEFYNDSEVIDGTCFRFLEWHHKKLNKKFPGLYVYNIFLEQPPKSIYQSAGRIEDYDSAKQVSQFIRQICQKDDIEILPFGSDIEHLGAIRRSVI